MAKWKPLEGSPGIEISLDGCFQLVNNRNGTITLKEKLEDGGWTQVGNAFETRFAALDKVAQLERTKMSSEPKPIRPAPKLSAGAQFGSANIERQLASIWGNPNSDLDAAEDTLRLIGADPKLINTPWAQLPPDVRYKIVAYEKSTGAWD